MKITLVRMSTESPPMEAPKIVFTIAKATTPPSAPVDCEVMMLIYSITVLFHILTETHLRSPVESEEAKDEDESTETSEGDRMARHLQRFSSLVEPGRIVDCQHQHHCNHHHPHLQRFASLVEQDSPRLS